MEKDNHFFLAYDAKDGGLCIGDKFGVYQKILSVLTIFVQQLRFFDNFWPKTEFFDHFFFQ